MSLRFWGTSKSVPTDLQIDDLAWFENSVHGGVVILGIFRDAIAMSPSSYVKQIAEKTLSIIRAISIASFGESGPLRVDLQKLGEATAAVTATILQSYLESENRDGWPGSRLQDILEDLIRTLDTIEMWISSGQAKNSFGRRKCVKMVKQFQERLSEVLERFEVRFFILDCLSSLKADISLEKLASLLRTYTVLPFIKKMIEDYALKLDAGAARLQSSTNADDLSKASPGSAVVRQNNLNLDHKQTYRTEKEKHDALRLKVGLILRIIEKEERNQQDESAPANPISSRLNQYPQELEKQRNISQPDERQDSLASKTGDHDNMEQDAVELLYDMLMDRLSSVAIFGPNTLPPTLKQPNSSSLPPSYSSVNNVRGQHPYHGANHNNYSERALKNYIRPTADELNLDKPLPPIVDTSGPWKDNGYQARKAENAYGVNKPFYRAIRIKPRGCASLPPGAMPPMISTASLLSEFTKGIGRTVSYRLPLNVTRHGRGLAVATLPVIGEEEAETKKPPEPLDALPLDKEEKPMTSPLSPEVKESIQPSRPPLSAGTDVDQEDKATNVDQRLPDVIQPVSKPTSDDDPGKEKGPIRPLDVRRPVDVLPSLRPVLPLSIKTKKPSGSLPLPPGAMPPKLSSWSPPPSTVEVKEEPPGHRGVGPGPTIPLPSTNANGKRPSAIQSNSSQSRYPGLTLNDNALRPTNFSLDNKEGSKNYHLPHITITSPITMAPLLAESSHTPTLQTRLQLPPPPPRPKHLGPGYEHLQKMSPQMQRYVVRLADRIWGGSEGVR